MNTSGPVSAMILTKIAYTPAGASHSRVRTISNITSNSPLKNVESVRRMSSDGSRLMK